MERDFKRVRNIYIFLLFVIACVLWALAVNFNRHLDGVAVYRLGGGIPTTKLDTILLQNMDSNRPKNTLFAMLKLMPVCVFPAVYNTLKGLTDQQVVQSLSSQNISSVSSILENWKRIDFSTWDNPFQMAGQPSGDYNMPYNLPYTGLDADKPLNPQYFSPACRCMNEVLDVYSSGKGTYPGAINALKACLATRNNIMQQITMGDMDPSDSDITRHKFISRHALLFNLCTAIFFSMVYNMLDFNAVHFFRDNAANFIFLALTFIIPFISQTFSFQSVHPLKSMQFSSLVHLPAAFLFLAVEWMWSHVAQANDVRRQTYLHPYSFYTILVHLHVIALIENGVFSFHVIVTLILQSIVASLAYTAVLFIAHGKLWQMRPTIQTGSPQSGVMLSSMHPFRTGELTGYIIILMLVGITSLFHIIPTHAINSELNFLWLLPMVFSVFCFAQIVLLEHLMGEDNDANTIQITVVPKTDSTSKPNKMRFTNSVHLLNTGHTIVVSLVIVYYAMQMHYVWHGDLSMLSTGGRLDKRLNFELAELNAIPAYTNLQTAPGKFLGFS